MRHLSAEQKSDTPRENSVVPNPVKYQRQTIFPHRHGPHHRATRKRWARCHTHHSRPRMLTSGHLPPLLHDHHRRRHSTTVSGTPIPMVRNSTKDHQRQGPPIHISLRTRTNQRLGNQPESVNGISPPNGWTIRANEPMGRTIPTPHHREPERMEQVATDGNRGPQQQQEFHHRLRPE
jgi:hypothetical protein